MSSRAPDLRALPLTQIAHLAGARLLPLASGNGDGVSVLYFDGADTIDHHVRTLCQPKNAQRRVSASVPWRGSDSGLACRSCLPARPEFVHFLDHSPARPARRVASSSAAASCAGASLHVAAAAVSIARLERVLELVANTGNNSSARLMRVVWGCAALSLSTLCWSRCDLRRVRQLTPLSCRSIGLAGTFSREYLIMSSRTRNRRTRATISWFVIAPVCVHFLACHRLWVCPCRGSSWLRLSRGSL